MKKQSSKRSARKVLALGVGIAALSAAAYALFGPAGSKNRKKLKGWALAMYGEIMDRVERTKDLTEPAFHKIVDEVSKKYALLKHIDSKDLNRALAEIKKQWKKIKHR